MRWLVARASLALVVLVGCTDPTPDGFFGCALGSTSLNNCPAGFECSVRPPMTEPRCWRGAADAFDAGPPPPQLAVRVASFARDSGGTALAGALVVLEHPDGTRVRMTTPASGRVVFDGIEWSGAPAIVTVSAVDHRIESFVGRSPIGLGVSASGELDVRLATAPRTEVVASIEISGGVPAETWTISPTHPGPHAVATGGTFTVPVRARPAGGDLFAIGSLDGSLVHAMYESLGDVDGDRSISMTATGVESNTARGLLVMPDWVVDLGEDATFDAYASSLASEGALRYGIGGFDGRPTADARAVPYTLRYGDPAGVVIVGRITVFEVRASSGARSLALDDGDPRDRSTDPLEGALLEPPIAPSGSLPRSASIAWTARDGRADAVTILELSDGTIGLWTVRTEPEMTEVSLPELEVEAEAVLGAGPFEARIHRCAGQASLRRGVLCERSASSAAFTIE